MKKLLAAASVGGHWIQLLRITKGLEAHCEVSYISTHEKCAKLVEGHRFHKIQDFSRWDAYKIIPAFFSALNILRKEKPDVVITTGAAPGLIVLFAACCLGKKTIWIDSIANSVFLSFSGKVAKRFASRFYTQWKDLSGKDVYYEGNVIG